MPSDINADTAPFCFLDLDFDNKRSKLAKAAAFVDATNTRYGLSCNDLRLLGGSEVARIPDLMANDHEWSSKIIESGGGIEVRPPPHGSRLVLKLFWDVAPLACENFATLCSNGSLLPGSFSKGKEKVKPAPIGESGKPLTYRGSVVHRVIPGFIIQGGDLVFGNGSGGESIYGKKFKDERAGLSLKHDRRGVLSMGNSGKNSNTSQWFLTFKPAPQCDGKHVVFGEIVSGWDVLDAAETYGTDSGDTKAPIVVTDCGVWAPFLTPGSGYWFDKPDSESFSGVSPVFMVRPRVAVVAQSQTVLDRFVKVFGSFACVTLVKADDFEDEAALVARITELLGSFAIDVVIVAPACKGILNTVKLPASWSDRLDEPFALNEVVIEAKPVEALTAVHSKSWLAQKTPWHLDGSSH